VQYAVRALSSDHLVTQLTLDASDEADARQQTVPCGLFPASTEPVSRPLLFSLKPRAYTTDTGSGAGITAYGLLSRSLLSGQRSNA
jgi:hypothetical protein